MNLVNIRKIEQDILDRLQNINTLIEDFNNVNNTDLEKIKNITNTYIKNQFPEIFVYCDRINYVQEEFQKDFKYKIEYDFYISIAIKSNKIDLLNFYVNCYAEILANLFYNLQTENIAFIDFVNFVKEEAQTQDLQTLKVGVFNIKAVSII